MRPFERLKSKVRGGRAAQRELRLARANRMNCEEGHLGGYIRASPEPAPSGLRIEHGDPETWTPALWRWAHARLGIRSVLDVGCGEGHCARFFLDLGCAALGIDGSVHARRDSLIPELHVVHDYVTGPLTPEGEFDLVWSCEFVEHVEERYAENFLASFRAGRRYAMITYAEPGQSGWHHVNCQPAAYWIERLARIGFSFDPRLTEDSRAVAEPGHYRRKGLLFQRDPT